MKANDSLSAFSEELKKIRESKDISLQEISNKTRIDLKFLKAMESGDFEVLPEVYLKAFLKEYAKAIDLDPKKTTDKYDLAKLGKYSSEDDNIPDKNLEVTEEEPVKQFGMTRTHEEILPEIEEMRSGSTRNYLPIIALIVIVIFILSLIYVFFVKDSSNDIIKEDSVSQAYYEERYEVADEPVQNKMQEEVDSLTLRIEASADSWYRAIIDDRSAEEFILPPDNSHELKAGKSIKLVIGNSSATKLFLNNNELNFSGNENQVKRVEITSEGLKPIVEKELSANE